MFVVENSIDRIRLTIIFVCILATNLISKLPFLNENFAKKKIYYFTISDVNIVHNRLLKVHRCKSTCAYIPGSGLMYARNRCVIKNLYHEHISNDTYRVTIVNKIKFQMKLFQDKCKNKIKIKTSFYSNVFLFY